MGALYCIGCGGGAAGVISGCGGSVKGDNSGYRGSYGVGMWSINGRSADSGSLTFTISEKGNMIGSIDYGDGSFGRIEGFFHNSGDFGATVIRGNQSFPVDGKFSRQTLSLPDPNDNTQTVEKVGLAGDFRITMDGVIFDGSFAAPGGVDQQ